MSSIFHRFLFRSTKRKRRVYSTTATPGNVSVTGVQGTGAVGALIPNIATGSLTGVSGIGAAGTVIPQVSAITIGVAGTGFAGTLTIQQGPIGVQGNGQVGSLGKQVSAFPSGAFGTGFAGNLNGSQQAFIAGVSGFGFANDVYPIPPAPRTRPPLLIPVKNGLPASLWLGSSG